MAKTRKREGGVGVAENDRVENDRLQSDRLDDMQGHEGAPQTAGDTTAANVDRGRVAARAYELYLARGGSDGQDLDDWLEAERELSSGDRVNRDSDPTA